MILGLGVDVVDLKRFEEVLRRFGRKFIDRVYVPSERRLCGPWMPEQNGEGTAHFKRAATRLAGRFAAKEAVLKALGTGLVGGMSWQHLEVRSGDEGAPSVTLRGRASELAAELGVRKIHVSISHTDSTAVAVAVLEGK
jgi:holo-[acyl-carrier protein] synthase